MDVDLVLGVPTESLAIRAIVASVAAVLGARLLLASRLRLPSTRVLAALLPALATVGIVVIGFTRAQLPLVLAPTDSGGLPIRVGGDYLNVSPLAIPVLIGLWALVALGRIGMRLRHQRQVRCDATEAFRTTPTRADSPRVRRTLRRVAGRLGADVPPVGITQGCAGGATVVGIRRPVVLVDERLVEQLDDLELEGVLAHEVAHIRRRDNLVAVVLGIVRDLAFFVPGGHWALQQLHRERELAADQSAVATTGRPGALASGLLKVIETSELDAACATLVPRGTLVGRVRHLIDDDPRPGRIRSGLELALVVSVAVLAVVGAVQLPALIRDGGVREGLIVLWHSEAESAGAAADVDTSSRVFEVYRGSEITTPESSAWSVIDDDPDEVRAGALQACARGGPCPEDRELSGLGLRPRPTPEPESRHVIEQWDATPVVSNDEGLSIYLLSSVSEGR